MLTLKKVTFKHGFCSKYYIFPAERPIWCSSCALVYLRADYRTSMQRGIKYSCILLIIYEMHNYLNCLLSGLGIIESVSLSLSLGLSVYIVSTQPFHSPMETFCIICTYIVGRAALRFIFHAMWMTNPWNVWVGWLTQTPALKICLLWNSECDTYMKLWIIGREWEPVQI